MKRAFADLLSGDFLFVDKTGWNIVRAVNKFQKDV